jgi:hypothetical protein
MKFMFRWVPRDARPRRQQAAPKDWPHMYYWLKEQRTKVVRAISVVNKRPRFQSHIYEMIAVNIPSKIIAAIYFRVLSRYSATVRTNHQSMACRSRHGQFWRAEDPHETPAREQDRYLVHRILDWELRYLNQSNSIMCKWTSKTTSNSDIYHIFPLMTKTHLKPFI